MLSKFVQKRKAIFSIFVIFSGIVILSKPMQCSKTRLLILVTFFPSIVSGIVISLSLPMYLDISTVPLSSNEYS